MPQQLTDPLSDHVVVLGHGRVGKYICRALSKSEIPYVVVDYNHHLVKSLQKQGVRVIYGDPAEIDVLNFAQVIHAKVAILAYADRHTQETVIANILTINPNIKLICRVHFEEDQKKLKGLGVELLIQPEFEAALSMVDRLLRMFNVKQDVIETKLKDLRKEHGLE
jgi:CPA2 family monovalent cation:H+ antiporter-2